MMNDGSSTPRSGDHSNIAVHSGELSAEYPGLRFYPPNLRLVRLKNIAGFISGRISIT
jgi:hypothetical protein